MRRAKSATFNGVNLLDGTSPSLNVVQDIMGSQIAIANQSITSAGLGLTALGVNSTALNLAFNNSFAVANGDKVVLSDGTKSYTFEYSDGDISVHKTFKFDHSNVVELQTSVEQKGAVISAFPPSRWLRRTDRAASAPRALRSPRR